MHEDMTDRFLRQINELADNRVERIITAFRELQAAFAAARLTANDFPEARAMGIDTSGTQVVVDNALRQRLGREVFAFVEGYEAARQRDLAAKNGNGDTRN